MQIHDRFIRRFKCIDWSQWSNALQLSNIYCPANGPCGIDAVGSSTTIDMLSQSIIHSPQAFDALQLRCNYSTDVNECYSDGSEPTLSCLPRVDSSCTIALRSNTMNDWHCTDIATVADLCVTTPPSAAPTDNPTKYPSQSPTINPTLSPTKYPSTNPSVNPSQSPMTFPTINPSVNPSASPTTFPSANPTKYPTAPHSFSIRKTDDEQFGEGEVSDKK
eukprot:709591_1